MKKLIGLAAALTVGGVFLGCSHVKGVQLPSVSDSPKVWVSIQSTDEDLNGVYRCGEEGAEPVCKKAKLTK